VVAMVCPLRISEFVVFQIPLYRLTVYPKARP
jgi:hypothetical protein